MTQFQLLYRPRLPDSSTAVSFSPGIGCANQFAVEKTSALDSGFAFEVTSSIFALFLSEINFGHNLSSFIAHGFQIRALESPSALESVAPSSLQTSVEKSSSALDSEFCF
jgi:hypothetical protein